MPLLDASLPSRRIFESHAAPSIRPLPISLRARNLAVGNKSITFAGEGIRSEVILTVNASA